MRIRAITLPQPWASMHVHGLLTIHTRSWHPARYGMGHGLLAIHAGVSQDGREVYESHAGRLAPYGYRRWDDLPRKAVVGTVTLHGAYRTELLDRYPTLGMAQRPLDRELGDFGAGRYAWLLLVPRAVSPVTVAGRPKLWTFQAPAGFVAELVRRPADRHA